MMRYLTLIEVLELHRQVIDQSGGAFGIREVGLLESAIAQPRMTFDGEELYPSLLEKAALLGVAIIMNTRLSMETSAQVTQQQKLFWF
jgi:death on curing protein